MEIPFGNKFGSKFKFAFREIDLLKSKIYQKEGIFFETHVYSKDELLNSEHHQKIDSITKKIGDDVRRWREVGNFSRMEEFDYQLNYQKNVDKVYDELNEVNIQISRRQPTFWESFSEFFERYIVSIMQNLHIEDLVPSMFMKLLPTPVRAAVKLISFKND